MRKSQRKPTELICRINVTGFLSIQVALLAMFLATTVPHRSTLPTGRSVDLAKVDHAVPMPGARREDALVVTIERDGQLFLGNDKVVASELHTKFREGANRGSERKVYIQSDKQAKYGAVLEVLDSVNSAGIENVAFLVSESSVGLPSSTAKIDRPSRVP
jgi:biopolymer transport protein TolR